MKRIRNENERLLKETVAQVVIFDSPDRLIPGRPSDQAMKIARKNSLGLEFIHHFSGAPELEEHERQRSLAFQLAMQETSALFAAQNIDHLWIKFRKLYLYYDTNIDVIVPADQWEEAVHLLNKEGYRAHVMFKEPDKLMFSRPGEKVSIHLHPGVTWNGVPYFSFQELWHNSHPSLTYPGSRELSDSFDYLVNLAHNLFENYEISLGDMLYFHRFHRSHPVKPLELETVAANNGWHYAFWHIYMLITDLVKDWEQALKSSTIPEHLFAYPYPIPTCVLRSAYYERVAKNFSEKRFRIAFREGYAYPAFYLLKRRHDLSILQG